MSSGQVRTQRLKEIHLHTGKDDCNSWNVIMHGERGAKIGTNLTNLMKEHGEILAFIGAHMAEADFEATLTKFADNIRVLRKKYLEDMKDGPPAGWRKEESDE